MNKLYVLVGIGCIECGVKTEIVGVFDDKQKAQELADKFNKIKDLRWRNGGENYYKVFDIDTNEMNKLGGFYKPFLEEETWNK